MRYTIIFLFLFPSLYTSGQKTEIGVHYGRAYFQYKHIDDGTGLRKANNSNYHFISGFDLKRNIGTQLFLETGLQFTMYEQYFSTRKYWGAHESAYPVIHIPLTIGYQTNKRLKLITSAGFILGIAPDQYIGEFRSRFVDLQTMTYDSITRGYTRRDYGSLFPLININLGAGYSINPNWVIEIRGSFAKGFKRITEFDIYYNDGSGSNDQHAMQWGNGDFLSLSLGIKYRIKNSKSRYSIQGI